jgi:hypothetical protein
MLDFSGPAAALAGARFHGIETVLIKLANIGKVLSSQCRDLSY